MESVHILITNRSQAEAGLRRIVDQWRRNILCFLTGFRSFHCACAAHVPGFWKTGWTGSGLQICALFVLKRAPAEHHLHHTPGAHALLLPPHGSRLRLRHPEERAAQPLPHVRQRQRQGGVPRLGPHHPEIPSDHRQRVQHPLPPQPARPGAPRPGRDLQSGRQDAEVPGRLGERSHHVPAGSGQAGGDGVGGGGGGGREEAGGGEHHGGVCVQHDHVRAGLAVAALLRELRLVRRARAGVRHQGSARQMSLAGIRILQI